MLIVADYFEFEDAFGAFGFFAGGGGGGTAGISPYFASN
jgi:hypothetical protein